MSRHSHRDEATFLRAALLLGLVSGEQVIAWATLTVEEEDAPSAEMIDLSTTVPELTALREALRPLASPTESEAIARRLIDVAAEDLAEGRRSLQDTLTVLLQLVRNVPVPERWARAIKELQDEFMLAQVGVAGHSAELTPQLLAVCAGIVASHPDPSRP